MNSKSENSIRRSTYSELFLTTSESLLPHRQALAGEAFLTESPMMADPLSITAGVVGIATATIQSAKTLYEILDNTKEGPGEIESVSRDAHAYYSIVFALLATLKENKVRHVVERDEAMIEMIRNLVDPLSHCQALLGELMVQIQKQLKQSTDAQGSRIIFIAVNWILFAKYKIRTLQIRLEASKSTLCSALNAFSLYIL